MDVSNENANNDGLILDERWVPCFHGRASKFFLLPAPAAKA
jgi:hypothetical protein